MVQKLNLNSILYRMSWYPPCEPLLQYLRSSNLFPVQSLPLAHLQTRESAHRSEDMCLGHSCDSCSWTQIIMASTAAFWPHAQNLSLCGKGGKSKKILCLLYSLPPTLILCPTFAVCQWFIAHGHLILEFAWVQDTRPHDKSPAARNGSEAKH